MHFTYPLANGFIRDCLDCLSAKYGQKARNTKALSYITKRSSHSQSQHRRQAPKKSFLESQPANWFWPKDLDSKRRCGSLARKLKKSCWLLSEFFRWTISFFFHIALQTIKYKKNYTKVLTHLLVHIFEINDRLSDSCSLYKENERKR